MSLQQQKCVVKSYAEVAKGLSNPEVERIRIRTEREALPIFKNKKRLMECISKNKTIVIQADTGSGKTTQIPQFIDEAGMLKEGKMLITEPRRVAVLNLANRVAQEYGNGMLGDYVGYKRRFENVTSEKTRIIFASEGTIIQEALKDRLFLNYSTVMLDEAHERSIYSDLLFGLLKIAQKEREEQNLIPLKIIVTSATLSAEQFVQYFDNCRVFYLKARQFPLKIHYLKKDRDDYFEACVETFLKIHDRAPPEQGVLIFLTGVEEIERCAREIGYKVQKSRIPVKICTLYAVQTEETQDAIFASSGLWTRKLVISTNVAETSITIPNITYVIDSGMVKRHWFSDSTGVHNMAICPITQEEADQRAGRVGRYSAGACFRMYSARCYKTKIKSNYEITKSNIAWAALYLLGLKIRIEDFGFINPPHERSVRLAYEELQLLEAITTVESNRLTPIGEMLLSFPLDIKYSKILYRADYYGCLEEAIIIASMISSGQIFLKATSKTRKIREQLHAIESDHLTLLNAFRAFESIIEREDSKFWCETRSINWRNIMYAREVRTQLQDICKSKNMRISSCGSDLNLLKKCLLEGLFMNVAERMCYGTFYKTVATFKKVQIHPSSTIREFLPQYIVFSEIVETRNSSFVKDVTAIQKEWTLEVAANYFAEREARRFIF